MSEQLYPFSRPEGPFHLGLRPLPRDCVHIAAIGALAAPAVLAAMLGPEVPVRIEPAWLLDHAVVWSAHACAGYVPATVLPRRGRARIHLLTVPAGMLRVLDRREGVPWIYRRIRARVVDGEGRVRDVHAYRSAAGPLLVDGEPVACAHAPFEGGPLPALDQRTLLELLAWNVGLASGTAVARLLRSDSGFRCELADRLHRLHAGPFARLLAASASDHR